MNSSLAMNYQLLESGNLDSTQYTHIHMHTVNLTINSKPERFVFSLFAVSPPSSTKGLLVQAII